MSFEIASENGLGGIGLSLLYPVPAGIEICRYLISARIPNAMEEREQDIFGFLVRIRYGFGDKVDVTGKRRCICSFGIGRMDLEALHIGYGKQYSNLPIDSEIAE